MKLLSRVVWSEGMYLAPHHFQAQLKYYEESVHFGNQTLWYEPWGFAGLDLDHDSLRNGTVAIMNARGIFPDGLVFDMPECDARPEPRNVRDFFPATRDAVTVFLAVPQQRAGGANCSDLSNVTETRFTVRTTLLHDDNTGTDEKSVQLAGKNIRLLFDTETIDGFTTMPIARVVRGGSGQFVYDSEFVPPCVRIAASESLLALIARVVEMLEAKSSTLTRSHKGSGQFQARISTTDVGTFWFLHTINSAISILRHLFQSKRGHPEELFREMSRLGGALCTFGLEYHPRTLPHYDHLQLHECFAALETHIRRHLEIVVPTSAVTIPLRVEAQSYWVGDITDQRCLDRARWLIGIRTALSDADTIARTPSTVKFCSSKFVYELVKRALPGLPLMHVPVPPSAVAARSDMQYFALTRSGPCWEHIVLTRQVGIYIPADMPAPEIELVIVMEN